MSNSRRFKVGDRVKRLASEPPTKPGFDMDKVYTVSRVASTGSISLKESVLYIYFDNNCFDLVPSLSVVREFVTCRLP